MSMEYILGERKYSRPNSLQSPDAPVFSQALAVGVFLTPKSRWRGYSRVKKQGSRRCCALLNAAHSRHFQKSLTNPPSRYCVPQLVRVPPLENQWHRRHSTVCSRNIRHRPRLKQSIVRTIGSRERGHSVFLSLEGMSGRPMTRWIR